MRWATCIVRTRTSGGKWCPLVQVASKTKRTVDVSPTNNRWFLHGDNMLARLGWYRSFTDLPHLWICLAKHRHDFHKFSSLSRPVARIQQQGGPKTRKGVIFLKYSIGCMQQPRGQTWNGDTDFKWRPGHHCPPRWRRTCFYQWFNFTAQ